MATFRLLAGQVVTADRSKPVLGADGKPTGRFERKVVNPGGTVESDRDLASAEPQRYALVDSGVADAQSRVAELEAELAALKAQKAGGPRANPEFPAVFPGGQVSSGFQAATATGSRALEPEEFERAGANAGDAGAEGGKPAKRSAAKKPARSFGELEPAEDDDDDDAADDLDGRTVAELRETAAAEGVELPAHARKDEIVQAIRAARAE